MPRRRKCCFFFLLLSLSRLLTYSSPSVVVRVVVLVEQTWNIDYVWRERERWEGRTGGGVCMCAIEKAWKGKFRAHTKCSLIKKTNETILFSLFIAFVLLCVAVVFCIVLCARGAATLPFEHTQTHTSHHISHRWHCIFRMALQSWTENFPPHSIQISAQSQQIEKKTKFSSAACRRSIDDEG